MVHLGFDVLGVRLDPLDERLARVGATPAEPPPDAELGQCR